MPRVKRKSKLRRAELTDHHVRQLLTGRDYFNTAFGRDRLNSTPDWTAMGGAWECLRDELMPKWIAENPCTRPYAWWKFDAPEPRRRIVYRVSEEVQDKIRRHSGAEALRIHMAACDGELRPESELAYLQRNGLLTDAELAANVL